MAPDNLIVTANGATLELENKKTDEKEYAFIRREMVSKFIAQSGQLDDLIVTYVWMARDGIKSDVTEENNSHSLKVEAAAYQILQPRG